MFCCRRSADEPSVGTAIGALEPVLVLLQGPRSRRCPRNPTAAWRRRGPVHRHTGGRDAASAKAECPHTRTQPRTRIQGCALTLASPEHAVATPPHGLAGRASARALHPQGPTMASPQARLLPPGMQPRRRRDTAMPCHTHTHVTEPVPARTRPSHPTPLHSALLDHARCVRTAPWVSPP